MTRWVNPVKSNQKVQKALKCEEELKVIFSFLCQSALEMHAVPAVEKKIIFS